MKLKYCVMLFALACLTSLAFAQGESVKGDYKTPTFVVPYASVKPQIDGAINDAEWQGALSVSALQTTNHAVSPRQARFWLLWDEDNLYLAMRSPLREGERLVQGLRMRDRDINVVFDDSYEIWPNVGSKSKDGQGVFFQFLSNFAGARSDVLYEPAVGNSRPGWVSGWEPKNRITPDGKAWEWEMVIPRQSLSKDTPFSDGFHMTCLLARNFKRPWEQNSIEGTSSFSVSDTYSHFILSKTAPAIHLLAVADPQAQTFGLSLQAFNAARADKVKWIFAGDGGVEKEGELAIEPGKLTPLISKLDLEKPGTGNYRIRVVSPDGNTTYLDWCALRTFGDLKSLTQTINDTGDQVSLSLTLNPVKDYVSVNGDFINYDARATIAKCRVTVTDQAGKALTEKDLQLDELAYVRGVLKLGALQPGDYTTKLTAFDKDGKALLSRESKFTKKDPVKEFPWWNTKLGNIERVISPWTPVTYAKNQFGVWGRTMAVGAAGLPKQITTQQNALLAGDITLVAQMADGKVVKATGAKATVVSQAAHRTVLKVTSQLGTLQVDSLVTVEFDGMYKVQMKLDPRKATAVKSLKMIVPFRNDMVDFVHAGGEGIRTGFNYSFLPKDKTGRIWDSYTVDGQPMVEGSFIPYVWLGNPKGGLCWFADSDEGWVPNNKVPAIEVRRDGKDSTDLVCNLISSDFTIAQPRSLTFAFEASPVKQMHAQWRMDSWWCGDTFRDFAQVEPKGGALIWTSLPYTLDTAKCKEMVEAQHKGSNGFIIGTDKYRANAVPYFENNTFGGSFAPEVSYFGDQWHCSISGGLCFEKTLTDYMIYHLGTWAKETGIDGFYIDNIRPVACDNIDAGRGYRLPSGKIQPTYQLFDTRTYYLRMRAAFAEQGKQNKIVLHLTNHMVLPWVGAADIAYDGEHNVIYPEMGKDFMDFWSLERMRGDLSDQWGTAVNFMHEYQGAWEQQALIRAMRPYTGMVLLYDALPSGDSNGMNQIAWKARDRFGIETNDVRFIGYWDKDQGLTCATPKVYLACWQRPGTQPKTGKVLIAVVNTGEKTEAVVEIDAAKLGVPALANCKIWDAETNEAITPAANGTLRFTMDRHDYRQIIVEPKP